MLLTASAAKICWIPQWNLLLKLQKLRKYNFSQSISGRHNTCLN